MFDSNFIEFFSHIKWYHILAVPFMVFAYLLLRIQSWGDYNPMTAFPTLLAGFLFWTLLEYLLHRFVFHSESYLPNSKIVRYLHFNLHGVHHMLPNDPYCFSNLATAWSTLLP